MFQYLSEPKVLNDTLGLAAELDPGDNVVVIVLTRCVSSWPGSTAPQSCPGPNAYSNGEVDDFVAYF